MIIVTLTHLPARKEMIPAWYNAMYIFCTGHKHIKTAEYYECSVTRRTAGLSGHESQPCLLQLVSYL